MVEGKVNYYEITQYPLESRFLYLWLAALGQIIACSLLTYINFGGYIDKVYIIYACLLGCFFEKFGTAIDGFSSETKEPNYINWVYFEQIIVKVPILAKIVCFSTENGILMGG